MRLGGVLLVLLAVGLVVRFWWLLALVAAVWVCWRYRAQLAEQLRVRKARADCAALGRHSVRCPAWHHEMHLYEDTPAR